MAMPILPTPAPMPLTQWGAAFYNGPPEIQITAPPTGINALTSSADLKALQEEANKKAAEAQKAAEAWNMSPKLLYEDAQEAFVGVIGDLLGMSERKSLKDIFAFGNRLRGLGIICVLLAFVGGILQWVLGPAEDAALAAADLL